MELLGDRIKLIRKTVGETQETFAQKIAIKRNTLAMIESQNKATSQLVINAICREYGVNLDYLLYGNEPMFAPKEAVVLDKISQWLTGDNEFVKSVFIEEANLSPDKWAVVQEFMEGVVARMRKKASE